jgi:hypothetical protein
VRLAAARSARSAGANRASAERSAPRRRTSTFSGRHSKRKSGAQTIIPRTSARYAAALALTVAGPTRTARTSAATSTSPRTRSGRRSGLGRARTPSWKNWSTSDGGEKARPHVTRPAARGVPNETPTRGEATGAGSRAPASTRAPPNSSARTPSAAPRQARASTQPPPSRCPVGAPGPSWVARKRRSRSSPPARTAARAPVSPACAAARAVVTRTESSYAATDGGDGSA